MTASLPSVRSALRSALDQLAELRAGEIARRPSASEKVIYRLRSATDLVHDAMSRLDGLDQLVQAPAALPPSNSNVTEATP